MELRKPKRWKCQVEVHTTTAFAMAPRTGLQKEVIDLYRRCVVNIFSRGAGEC